MACGPWQVGAMNMPLSKARATKLRPCQTVSSDASTAQCGEESRNGPLRATVQGLLPALLRLPTLAGPPDFDKLDHPQIRSLTPGSAKSLPNMSLAVRCRRRGETVARRFVGLDPWLRAGRAAQQRTSSALASLAAPLWSLPPVPPAWLLCAKVVPLEILAPGGGARLAEVVVHP